MAVPSFFERLKQYVGFDDDSAAQLRRLHSHASAHFDSMVEDFYAAVERHPDARAVLSGSEAQVARLKVTLRRWMESVLVGPHDEAYFQTHARIGRVHVQVALPQALMFTAMSRIRSQLMSVAETAFADASERGPVLRAVGQILDLELAIMLETYREDLEAKNRTAERLSTIGQLAAGIGHEVRNPLSVIESSAFLLRQALGPRLEEDPRLPRHLDKIGAEVRRANKTIDDLLELARNRPPRRNRVELHAVLQHARSLVPVVPGVTVEMHVAPGLVIDADPDQLAQVVSNLVLNAQQAVGRSGHVQIEAWREDTAAFVRVRDDGPGVPPNLRTRVFEALFTTKAKGSGLGLALCRRIAEAHGGTLELEESQPGASFVLRIPDSGS